MSTPISNNNQNAILSGAVNFLNKHANNADNNSKASADPTSQTSSSLITPDGPVIGADLKIFISYTHRYRSDDVRKVADLLKAVGFLNVWIDVYEITDDIFEDISEAIDGASLVVIFYNKDYKESDICRMEATCAVKRKKPILCVNMDEEGRISGWVEFMLQQKLWIAFPTKRTSENIVAEIVERIRRFVQSGKIGPEKQQLAVVDPIPNIDSQDPVNTEATVNNNDEDLDLELVEVINTTLLDKKQKIRYNVKHVEVPPFTKASSYHKRSNDEQMILEALKQTCLFPKNGILMLRGGGGVGKTTIMSQLVMDEANYEFLVEECNVHVVVWLNCFRWRDPTSFDKKAKEEFVHELCQRAQEAVGKLDKSSPLQTSFRDVDDIGDYFAENPDKGILFILDDAFNVGLFELTFGKCPKLPWCAVAREKSERDNDAAFVRETIVLDSLRDEVIAEMLTNSFRLKNHLNEEQIQYLAKRCCGLPLLAGLISALINDCDSPREVQMAYKRLHTVNIGDLQLPDNDDRRKEQQWDTVNDSFHVSIKRIGNKRLLCYFAFLFFDPAEPISPRDLGIFWGMDGVRGEEFATCVFFEKRFLATAVKEFAADKTDFFLIHQTLHEAAQRSAKEYFGVDSLAKIRFHVVTGGVQLGAGPKHSLTSSILYQMVKQQRRSLLEKVLAKCDPDDLALLMSLKVKEAGDKTFLHFLYNATWQDDTVNRYYPHDSIKNSYRLIYQLMDKMPKSGDALKAAVTDCDGQMASLLTSVFDDEDDPVAQYNRNNLINMHLNTWRADYEAAKWEKTMFENPNFREIVVASKSGRCNDLDRLLQEVRKDDEHLAVALRCAARHDDFEMVKMLFNRHRDLTRRVPEESFSHGFMLAASSGNLALCQLFISHGAKPTFNGRSILMYAARNGHLAIVKEVDRTFPELVTMTDKDNMTALDYAARHGYLEIVEFLVSRYAAAIRGFQGPDKPTPLTTAASNRHLEVVQYLCKCSEEALKNPSSGYSVLIAAALGGDLQVVQFVYEAYPPAISQRYQADGSFALEWAVKGGDLDCVEFIYNRFPEAINWFNNSNTSVLNKAAKMGSLPLVEFLYDKMQPESIHLKSDDGYSAFATAAYYGFLDIVKFFVEKDPARCLLPDREDGGHQAINAAAMMGQLHVVRYLHEFNNNLLKWRCPPTSPAIGDAALCGHLDVVEFIRTKNPDPDQFADAMKQAASNKHLLPIAVYLAKSAKTQQDRLVAMKELACNGFVEAFQEILEIEPRILKVVEEDTEKSAVFFAAESGHFDVARFLLELDPNLVLAVTIDGEPLLHFACQGGNLQLVDYVFQRNRDALKVVAKNQVTAMWRAAKGKINPSRELFEFLYREFPEAARVPSLEFDANLPTIPLTIAVVSENAVAVKFLLEKEGREMALFCSEDIKMTPIEVAAFTGSIEMLECFASAFGPAIFKKKREISKYYPIFWPAGNGNVEVVRYFLKMDPTIYYECSITEENLFALFIAINEGHLDVVRCIVEELGADATLKWQLPGQNITYLMKALEWQKLEIAKYLIEAFPEIAAMLDVDGDSALTFAVIYDREEIIELLAKTYPEALRMGNKLGHIPLTVAVKRNNWPLAKRLFELAPETINCNNELPGCKQALMVAAEEGSWLCFIELAKLSHATPSDLTAVNDDDELAWSAVFHAARQGDLEAVKFLCQQCGPKECLMLRDARHRIPIIVAATYGQLDIVRFMDEQLPDVVLTVEDEDNRTAAYRAIFEDQLQVVEYLLKKYPELPKRRLIPQGSPEDTTITLAALKSKVEIFKCLYEGDQATAQSDNKRQLMHYAVSVDNVDVVKFLSEVAPESLLSLKDGAFWPIGWAALNEADQSMSILQDKMWQQGVSISQALALGESQNVIGLVKGRTLRTEQWQELLAPFQFLMSGSSVISLSPSDKVPFEASLGALQGLSDNNYEFCQQFIEAGGLPMLPKLLSFLRRPPLPLEEDGLILVCSLVCNVSEFPTIADHLGAADYEQLMKDLIPEINAKNLTESSCRQWLAAKTISSILCSMNRKEPLLMQGDPLIDSVAKDLPNRLREWKNTSIFVEFKSLAFTLPMMQGIDNKLPIARAIRQFALWFLRCLIKDSKRTKRNRNLFERENIVNWIKEHVAQQLEGELEAKHLFQEIIKWFETVEDNKNC